MKRAGENANMPDAVASAFEQAVRLASSYRGATSPNPPVGCAVLDKDGAVLALAAHQTAGKPHAEALALQQCVKDGTFYRIHSLVVTLEPCNHTGRTPPCVDAILSSPAKEVWIGARDPNAKAGGGAERLSRHGVRVLDAKAFNKPLAELSGQLIAPFGKRATTGLPWITVKQAMTRGGSMIPPPGQKTFTSSTSLVLAHRLRKQADAILTGSGTVLSDNPQFTVRHVADFAGKTRQLLIADRRKRVSGGQLAAFDVLGFSSCRITNIEDALRFAAENGALEVLVEAGPTLTAQILGRGLWDTHVTIWQGNGGAPDTITINHRGAKDLPVYEEDHVFRNH